MSEDVRCRICGESMAGYGPPELALHLVMRHPMELLENPRVLARMSDIAFLLGAAAGRGSRRLIEKARVRWGISSK